MPVYQRICPVCGELFTATRRDAKYCQPQCAHTVWRSKNREKVRKTSKKYYYKNREKINTNFMKKYYERNGPKKIRKWKDLKEEVFNYITYKGVEYVCNSQNLYNIIIKEFPLNKKLSQGLSRAKIGLWLRGWVGAGFLVRLGTNPQSYRLVSGVKSSESVEVIV
jgi:predicted nucleic acid-binding Zn ribbon protein